MNCPVLTKEEAGPRFSRRMKPDEFRRAQCPKFRMWWSFCAKTWVSMPVLGLEIAMGRLTRLGLLKVDGADILAVRTGELARGTGELYPVHTSFTFFWPPCCLRRRVLGAPERALSPRARGAAAAGVVACSRKAGDLRVHPRLGETFTDDIDRERLCDDRVLRAQVTSARGAAIYLWTADRDMLRAAVVSGFFPPR